jgi:soluble lytic murein transglycosylase
MLLLLHQSQTSTLSKENIMLNTAALICLTALSMNMRNADVICDNSQVIAEVSEKYNIDPTMIIAIGRIESAWTPTAKSPANACGIMQVLPKYSKKYGDKGRNLTCKELKDPETAIRVGTRIFNFWYYKYSKRNERIALCGYNAGFRCKGKNKNKQGLRYAKAVLKYRKLFKNNFKRQKRKYTNNIISTIYGR